MINMGCDLGTDFARSGGLEQMPAKNTTYDVADYLTSEARVAAYLELAMEEGDPKAIATALGLRMRVERKIA
jgi:DNA-binding phage protein